MQIKVITIKMLKEGITKEGKMAGQPWKLFKLTGEDGKVYTTLANGAEVIKVGSIIEPAEVMLGEERDGVQEYKFKKFSLVSAGTGPASQPPGADKNGMTPGDWAEKDRLERWSRECNTCFMGISQMVSAIFAQPQETRRDEIPEPLLSSYRKALKWADEHFNGQPAVATPVKAKTGAPQSKSTGTKEESNTMSFANVGEFYTACLREFKLQKSKVDSEIVGIDLTKEDGRKEAWQIITQVYVNEPMRKWREEPPDEKGGAKEEDTAKAEAEASAAELFG